MKDRTVYYETARNVEMSPRTRRRAKIYELIDLPYLNKVKVVYSIAISIH